MAQPPLKRETALEAIQRVEDKLREGFRPKGITGTGNGAIAEAAAQAVREGWVNTISSFETRVRIARDTYGLELDDSLYRPRHCQHRAPTDPPVADTGSRHRATARGKAGHGLRHWRRARQPAPAIQGAVLLAGSVRRQASGGLGRVGRGLDEHGLLFHPPRPGDVRGVRQADLCARPGELSRLTAGVPAGSRRSSTKNWSLWVTNEHRA